MGRKVQMEFLDWRVFCVDKISNEVVRLIYINLRKMHGGDRKLAMLHIKKQFECKM